MSSIFHWKNKLPDSWECKPLKSVANYWVSNVDKLTNENEEPVQLCNYTDVYKNEYISLGIEFMNASATKEEIRKFKLEVGDIIITKDSESWDDIAIPALVKETKNDLLCGYHLALLRPDTRKLFPDFLFRCLQAKVIRLQLELASTGVTRYGLPKDEIGRLLLPIPDLKTQKAIAKHIDKETKQIDRLIESKGRLLTLLAEKKQALITHAVTKGINPNARMKDSGIDWLGEIPENWKVKKLKYVTTKIGSGVTPKGGAEVYQNEGIPLLRSQNVHFEGLRLDDVVYISEDIHESMLNSKVQKGDVLINITGASIGRCYFWEGQYDEANVNQHVCILRPNDAILSEYLTMLLSCDVGQNQVAVNQVGGGREGLTFESLKSFDLPLPKKVEQREIIKTVRTELYRLTSLEEFTEKSIRLLKERRAALIAAVVTGEVDVN